MAKPTGTFPGMRVPLWIVFPLCVIFVAMLFWSRVRNHELPEPADLPPSAPPNQVQSPPATAELALVTTPPETPQTPELVATPVDPEPEPEADVIQIELTDLEVSPGLFEYAEHAPLGAAAMAELAGKLESQGQFQRALLAWERILDTIEATDDQRRTAAQAVTRLRPTLPDWNTDPQTAIPLVLHLSADASYQQTLTPLVDELPKLITTASSSIISITVKTSFTKIQRTDPNLPAAVAVWLSSAKTDGHTTEVTTFTPRSGEATTEAIRPQLLRAIFRIVAAQLEKSNLRAPNHPPATEINPAEDLGTLITRAHWNQFAASLTSAAE